MELKNQDKTRTAWLMEGDPSIRFQTLRDILHAPVKEIEQERKRILTEGWGKQLMDLQEENGSWSEALYSPKWTSTFYTLLLLKRLGAPPDPQLAKSCRLLLDSGFFEKDGGISYWKTWKQGECCVSGMLLSMLCHFGIEDERIHRMAAYLLAQQMDDRGWNCEVYRGARHGSFHTTISVLEGFREYEKAFPGSPIHRDIREKQREGIEFLLQHHLFQSSTTGETFDPKMTRLSFPPRWRYDIMRCLDYLQERDTPKDVRMADAVQLLKDKQTPEGFWKLELKYPGKVHFDLERVGKPSRWNTLRAIRVFQWWESGE